MVVRIVSFLLFSLLAAEVVAQDVPVRKADPLSLARRLHLRLVDRLPREDEFDQVIAEADLDALTDRLLATPEFLSVCERLWAEWLGLENPKLRKNVRLAIQGTAQVDHRLDKWFTYQQPLAESDEEAFDRLEKIGPILIGSGLECTRCHDHPFEAASQKEFLTLSAWFRSGGIITQPETIYEGTEPGDKIKATIPKGFGQVSPRRFGEPFPGLERHKITKERKHIAQFANWVSGFSGDNRTEWLLLSRYLAHFTGNESIVYTAEQQLQMETSLRCWRSGWRSGRLPNSMRFR